MSYSSDLRRRAIDYVSLTGNKSEAARIFGIHRQTLYNWLKEETSSAASKTPRFRRRKLDKAALADHVRDFPDALLRERAVHFGVHVNAVWVALKRLNIVKKNDEIC